MPLIVIKVGGSLLELPELPDRLRHLRSYWPESDCLLVAGGGRMAEVVREWDRIHQLGDDAAHWLAIRSMTLSMELLARLLPEAVSIIHPTDLEEAGQNSRLLLWEPMAGTTILEVEGYRLPHHWDVTSDSLAAAVAESWGAERLALAKSIPLPAGNSWSELAEQGAVDRYFPKAAARVPCIEWVNLRDPAVRVQPVSWHRT